MVDFKFPDVGEGIIEGRIVKWHVKEGDTPKIDQVLAEIETDKAIVEIPSPRAEKIVKLHGKEGETIKVGAPLVTFEGQENNKGEQKGVGVIGTLEVSDAVMKAPKKSAPPPAATATATTTAATSLSTASSAASFNMLPRTRILAEQLDVDIAAIKGSGPDGRITDEDIKKAAQSPPPRQPVKIHGPIEKIPYTGIRKIIGERMSQSVQNIPHVTMTDDADITLLVARREKEKTDAESKGIKLTFFPYIIKALVETLKAHPIVNASLDETANEIIIKKYYNIGFAVDTEDGLLVPVIKDADKKSLLDIARELFELAEKARSKKIQPSEMEGHTVSITNYGSFGGVYATPIINYPDAAILGIGRMKETPVAKEGTIEIRKILALSFAFDHRIFDGATAAKFLKTLKEQLEK